MNGRDSLIRTGKLAGSSDQGRGKGNKENAKKWGHDQKIFGKKTERRHLKKRGGVASRVRKVEPARAESFPRKRKPYQVGVSAMKRQVSQIPL